MATETNGVIVVANKATNAEMLAANAARVGGLAETALHACLIISSISFNLPFYYRGD